MAGVAGYRWWSHLHLGELLGRDHRFGARVLADARLRGEEAVRLLAHLGARLRLPNGRAFWLYYQPDHPRALEMRRSRVRQVGTNGAAHAPKQEVGKVDPQRQLLRLVDFEQQVGVAHDNTRRVAAQLAEGVDGVERGHRRATDQAADADQATDQAIHKATNMENLTPCPAGKPSENWTEVSSEAKHDPVLVPLNRCTCVVYVFVYASGRVFLAVSRVM